MPIATTAEHVRPHERVSALAALFYTGFASAALLVFKPLIVGALIQDYGYSARQAGLVAGGEMGGIGVAAFLSVLLAGRWSRRTVVAVGVCLGMVGCVGAAVTQTFAVLLAFRIVAGLGSGLVASMVLSTLGMTRNPDRTFGLYFITNYTLAACLFPVMAAVLDRFSVTGGYLFLAVLLAGCYLTMMWMPASAPQGSTPASTAPFPWLAATMSLSVSLAFWIGNGAVWAFVARIGADAGMNASRVGSILSVAQVAAIAGALTASLIHVRFGRALPLLVTIAISVTSILLIGLTHINHAFLLGAALFCFSWSSFLAYLNGLMASQDSSGRIVALSISSQTIGMTIGPILAGVLADAQGYSAIVSMGVVCHLGALLLLIPLVWKRRSPSDHVAIRDVAG